MNKKNNPLRLIAACLAVLTLLPALSGCQKKITAKNRVFYEYFDTVSTVYDYSGGSDKRFQENAELVRAELEYYHRLFDIYNEYDGINNVATLNRLAGEWVVLAPELIEFLEYAVGMHALTGGNMNIAMGSVLSIWHEYREEGKAVPTMAELEAAAEHTDITKLEIDKSSGRARLCDSEMSLDVGAIAKGYAVERIAEMLEARGADSYVLDVGGNLRAIGEKPDGSAWRTGIKNPNIYDFNTPYVHYLDVKDTSVVTSGDYQRFYLVDGVSYHHIIDKDTLMPANYFASVTIVTSDSGLADALSTALFTMDYDSGRALASTIDDITVVWVTKDGEVLKFGE